MSAALPLRLALEPLIATRTPAGNGSFEHGFRLRLPGGPIVLGGDPLLWAYGARVTPVAIPCEDDEPLQHEGFDPGRLVRLVAEPAGEWEDEVGVWDGDGLRRAGSLLDAPARSARAALECGLGQQALVLTEDRSVGEDRREGLDLLVFAPALVEIDLAGAALFERPLRHVRPRLVLVAGAGGELRWWDPSGEAGPMEAGDPPISAELRRALHELRDEYAELREQADGCRGFDRLEASLDRVMLDDRAAALWKRARGELGGSYAVGFLGAGMEHPVWSPDELDDDDEDL